MFVGKKSGENHPLRLKAAQKETRECKAANKVASSYGRHMLSKTA
ncbi:hypothetical protein tpqmel_0054 [Candidatus Gastranaerophilus sp. (ex Termes propinquus)]|nr:hypothetical protein tpqmel_0054 [Candidatus Gastranaerophilus sp. (ex Termes propinquus)]